MIARNLLAGIAAGMVAAYLLDPNQGRRRRALAGNKLVRASRKTRDALDATARDFGNRSRGVVAATRGRLARENVDDWRLVERVRAKLGRVSSHPRAIDVKAADGTVTLRGPVLANELGNVIGGASSVRGLRSVVNELEPHESADVPSQQGEGRVSGPMLDILQKNWAPATQALLAAAGLAAAGLYLTAYSRR
jgi:hypothetical protein